MKGRLVGAAILALVVSSGCEMSLGNLAGRASDEWTRSYQLSPGGELQIGNTNGKIEIEGVDGSTVEIRAERIAKAATDEGARELLPKIVIKEDVSKDRIAIETERISGVMIGAAYEVRYHVKAPKAAIIRATNTNGAVTLTGLAGRISAQTTNGTVSATGITGGIAARSTNGRVSVEMASLGRDQIDLSTTNGGVLLTLPDKAKADIEASCTNGGIDVSDLTLDYVGERNRRHLEGRMNGGGTRVVLHTTNGGVRVKTRSMSQG